MFAIRGQIRNFHAVELPDFRPPSSSALQSSDFLFSWQVFRAAMFISGSAPQDEKWTANVSRQDREDRKEGHASATPSVLLRLIEIAFSMPWKFRIFNRRCRRWTQMEQPGESPKLLCALCVLCEKWIEIGIGNLELPHGGNALPSRRIAHRKLLRASAPLRDNKAVRIGACVPFAPLAPLELNGSKDSAADMLLCAPLRQKAVPTAPPSPFMLPLLNQNHGLMTPLLTHFYKL
jgi:hypothetical protein